MDRESEKKPRLTGVLEQIASNGSGVGFAERRRADQGVSRANSEQGVGTHRGCDGVRWSTVIDIARRE
ncbi:MAG TPA: hypothetical protein VGH30_00920, partial [Jatrophihabitantaceae bacterium]